MDHFQTASANRFQETQYNNLSLSAVNALSLARDLPWEDSFRLLLDQGKRYGLLLTDRICVENMLKEAGYVRIRGFRRLESYAALNEYLADHYPGVSHALATTCLGRRSRLRICAVRRQGSPEAGFTSMDIREEAREIISLRLYYAEIGAPKPVPDPRKMHQEKVLPSHKGFLYYQPNPTGNNTGDCVIRAYSALFGLSWEETLDMLAQSSGYRNTTLNSRLVYQLPAAEYECDPHSRMTEEGKGLTGIEFCDRMTLRCRNGERFFAHVGNDHVVGIIPTVINGEKQYAVADSWDSSSLKIGKYWVYRPAKKKEKETLHTQEKPLPSLAAGETLVHPVFGRGTVQEILDDEHRVRLFFPQHGEKWLTVSWVQMNCRKSEDVPPCP